jgi:DNA-binding CsgD family transcriptional regulator
MSIFQEYDTKFNMLWYQIHLAKADEAGYSTVSECIYTEYFKKGKSSRAVGKILGISGSSVIRCMRVAGWEPRANDHGKGRTVLSKEAVREICHLREDGHSCREIAHKFKCDPHTVLNYERKYGKLYSRDTKSGSTLA